MRKISCLAIIVALSGCQEALLRSDRISPHAGDALSVNYANQMVDPWPYYVYDTDIQTSSERQAAVRNLYRTKYNKDDKAATSDPLYLLGQPPAAGTDPAMDPQANAQ